MGASKRVAELILQALSNETNLIFDQVNNETFENNTQFSMVRFGNVLGSSGSVVPLFRRQIKQGGPVTVTDSKVIRYFMTIEEASELVIQAGSLSKGGDVFVLEMGSPVNILSLAKKMIELSGYEIKDKKNTLGDIEIEITGLREGEKLYEELLVNNQAKKTAHPLIMSAIESGPGIEAIGKYLKLLEVACSENDIEAIRDILVDSGTGLNYDGNIVDYSFKGIVV